MPVEVVPRDEVFQRDSNQFIEAAGFRGAEHRGLGSEKQRRNTMQRSATHDGTPHLVGLVLHWHDVLGTCGRPHPRAIRTL
jgi:hypothetical protein